MDSEFMFLVKALRAGQTPEFPPESTSVDYARRLDAQDRLSFLRDHFIIPSKGSLKKKVLDGRLPGE